MRETLRMGQTQPRVTFEEVTFDPHSYAVGALPNLDGEITIFDGKCKLHHLLLQMSVNHGE
jgi:hypothetical protein